MRTVTMATCLLWLTTALTSTATHLSTARQQPQLLSQWQRQWQLPKQNESLDENDQEQQVRRQLIAQTLHASVGVLVALNNNDDNGDNNNNNNKQEISLRRVLQDGGPFAALNELLAGAIIRLPNLSASPGSLDLELKSPYCQNIRIGDIVIRHTMESPQRFAFDVRLTGLSLECYSDYDYDWRLGIGGSGKLFADVRESSAGTTLYFTSPNFDTSPPASSASGPCESNVQIHDLDFSGGFVNSLLDTFEESFRGLIANEVEDVLCDELSSLGTTFVGDLLDWAKEELDIYLQGVPPDRANPEYLEDNLNVPAEINLLDFQNLEESLGSWVTDALEMADSLFGQLVNDPTAPDGSGQALGINAFLRQNILDQNRGLTVNIADLPFPAFNPTLFSSHDLLTETSVTLTSVRFFGLDTFTKFDPLVALKKYTLQNTFHLDYVNVELDLTVSVKPSSKDDSIIEVPSGNRQITETISVDFGVDNLNVALALLVAIDEDRLKALEVGGLLTSGNIFACFVATLFELAIAGFDVSVGNIRDPVLTGFISPGIDRIVSEAIEAVFLMYEKTFLSALPAMFQGPFRDIVQEEVLASDLFNQGSCTWLLQEGTMDEYMDFRDLFLPPDEAKTLGGSGDEPYGNIGHMVFDLFRDRIVRGNGDGPFVAINDILIKPITRTQSGTAGLLRFPSNFTDMSYETQPNDFGNMIAGVDFSMGDLRVGNLTTVVAPIELLSPTTQGSTLWNDLMMSPSSPETIDLRLALRLAIDGEESPWTMNDEIDFKVSLNSMAVTGKIKALVETTKFLRMPLGQIFDINCWLATIPPQDGVRLFSTYFAFVGMDMDAECIACSDGLGLLPNMLSIFRSAGAVGLLGTRLSSLTKNIVESNDPLHTVVDRMISEAQYSCPVSSQYDPDYATPEYPPIGYPELSGTDLDTLLFASMLVTEIGLVAIAENHRTFSYEPTSPLALQAAVDPQSDYLDWGNFGTSLGFGEIGDQLFESALDYLEGRDDEGNLRVNAVIDRFLLDGEDTLILSFDDTSLQLDDIAFSLKEVKVDGLNGFQSLKLANPIGPQTLANEFTIERLAVEIVATIDVLSTEEPPQDVSISFGVNDLSVNVALFAAFSLEKVENLQLGSVVDTDDLLSCVLSTAESLSIPSITVTSVNLEQPEIKGLMTDSAAVVSATWDSIFEEFQSNIEEAIPVLMDTSVRRIVNSVVESLLEEANCPEYDGGNGLVDYRSMFNGESPYGNIPALAMDLVKSMFFSPDSSTGLAQVNSLLRSWTESSFGSTGVWGIPDNLIDTTTRRFRKIGINLLEFAFGKISIENLDTVKAPVVLLEPTASNGTLLSNHIGLGGEPNPIRLSAEVLLETRGDPALTSRNDLQVLVDITDIDAVAKLFAKIGLDEFMSFRLKRVLDVNCWLALFYTNDGSRDLFIESVSLAVSSFVMRVKCAGEGTCSSGLPKADVLLKNITEGDFGNQIGELVMGVVEGILEGDFFHSMLDEIIQSSAEACPDVSVEPSRVRRGQESGFPVLSTEALQKVAAVTMFVLEAGAIGVFESHSSFSTEWDPLLAQNALTLNQTELIDFTNFTTSMGDWANTLVDELRSYAEGGEDGPRINELLRDFYLDDSGVLAFDLSHVSLGGNDFELSLVEIRLKYLDTLSEADILDMVGPQTIRNVIQMRRVRGELDFSVRIGTDTILPLTVHMELEDIDAAFSILLAVNKDVLGDIELGQLLFRENIMKCFFAAMPEVSTTELDFSAARISSFGLEGVGEQAAVLESVTSLVLDLYGERVAELMKPFFGTTIRAILNNWFEYMVQQKFETGCPLAAVTPTDRPAVDLRDLLLSEANAKSFGASGTSPYGDLFNWAMDAFKDNLLDIDEETGLSDANGALIAPLTKTQSKEAGRVSFPGDIFATDTRVQVGGLDALINLRLYDAYVRNLDTVGAPLSILEPIEGKDTELSNTATFGKSEPVQVGFQFYISVSDPNSEIRNDLSVGVDLDSIFVLVDALLKLSEERFFTIPVRHLTDLNCWLYMLPAPALDARGISKAGELSSLALTKLDASIGRVRLNVTCNDCTSPGMDDLSNLLSTTEAADAATDVANMLFDYITNMLGGDYLQDRFDMLLNDAEHKCPISPLYDPGYVAPEYAPFESPEQETSLRALILLAISAGIIIFAVLFVMTCVKCIVRRRHRRWIRRLEGRKVQALLQLQLKQISKETELNETSQSLFRSGEVPVYIRWGMPVVILGNIGFFLSGHLSLGATVNIEAHLAEQEFSVENFFEFSMLRSTLEIWDAGGKELAIMIFIFSVIWPYTKQLITMAVWFASPRVLPISRRGSTLLWLDTLAKWSMVDIMSLIVTIAGFRISVKSPEVGFLPPNFYGLDLLVVPMWGLYANMIAQLISQLSSHAIVHYHRRIEEKATEAYESSHRLQSADTVALEEEVADDFSTLPSEKEQLDDSNRNDSERAEKLAEHAFSRPHRGEPDRLIVRRGTNSVLVFFAITVTVLVLIGCVIPSFSLEIQGVLGVVVESGQEFEAARSEYSVFTIIGLLFDQANFTGRTADYLGLGSLAGLLISSVLIVPIVQSMVLLYIWFTPMADRRRRRLAIAVEVLQAWQYAEVYLMSVVVASWQLGPVSDFMINTYCENLRETFAQMVYYGILKEEDAQCFRVNARLESASYVLAAASVALALLNTFVMRAVNQYFRDIDLSKREFKAMPGRDGEEIEDVTEAVRRVQPVPVLFSDAFRWFLIRQDSDPSRRTFVAQEVGDTEINGNTRDVLSEAVDLMADHMHVKEVESFPTEPLDYDGYADYAETDIFDDPKAYFNSGEISAVPHPGQPAAKTVFSNEAVRDCLSSSASLAYENGCEKTILSAVSELTEPQTEPWRDV